MIRIQILLGPIKVKILLSPGDSNINLFNWYILLSYNNNCIEIYFFYRYILLLSTDNDINIYIFFTDIYYYHWVIIILQKCNILFLLKYSYFQLLVNFLFLNLKLLIKKSFYKSIYDFIYLYLFIHLVTLVYRHRNLCFLYS